MTRILSLTALLFIAGPSLAENTLSPAFTEARATAASSQAVRQEAERFATLRATASFIPERCSVESWCLVKATECFLGQTTRPTGLWKAFTQYSVVRRVRALCPTGRYGEMQSRIFMGPVEPQAFSSAIETTEEKAVDSALKLCRVYRADWVSAAPACEGN